MTTFYQRILAASTLTVGTVWELISNPKTGSGTVETIYIEQIKSVVSDDMTTSEIEDSTVQADVSEGVISSTVSVFDAQTALLDNTIRVETI